MTRKISVSWFKQRSGWYALKGISILEDNHAYDSASTFREEDAKWVTIVNRRAQTLATTKSRR